MAIDWGQVASGAATMLPGLLSGAGGAALVNSAYDTLGEVGATGFATGAELADTALQQTQFKPFTITSATGSQFGQTMDDQGSISATSSLSPQEQAYQQMMMSQASQFGQGSPYGLDRSMWAGNQAYDLGNQFMTQAGQDTSGREQDIYGRIRAMQTPEEQRQSMALEERLAAQGRLGVQTNMYGGTPEQMALEKAREESQNQASYMAMQQAQQEQMQQANLGQNFTNLSGQMANQRMGLLGGQLGLSQQAQQGAYVPQAALLDSLQPGLTAAGMGQQGQLTGAQMYGESIGSGLDAMLGASLGQANMIGSLGSGLLTGATSPDSLADFGSGFMDFLGGFINP